MHRKLAKDPGLAARASENRPLGQRGPPSASFVCVSASAWERRRWFLPHREPKGSRSPSDSCWTSQALSGNSWEPL
jgi:hypothetical protein